MPEIDHLVFAAPDLEGGVRHIEELTGARAVPGGPHPGIGTRNALLTFDAATYFEIIAVDPDQPEPPRRRPFGLDDPGPPRLAGFAVHPAAGESLDSVAELLRAGGFDPGPVSEMRRTTPAGEELRWRLTRPPGGARPGGGVIPFVIDWGATPSPALSAPPLGALEVLRVRHPDPAVRAALAALALPLDIGEGPPALAAVVRSARGTVTVS